VYEQPPICHFCNQPMIQLKDIPTRAANNITVWRCEGCYEANAKPAVVLYSEPSVRRGAETC
jgi:hypothetical protein